MPSPSQLWHVYHVENCRHTRPPKNKYVVIVHIDTTAYGCLINSTIHPWVSVYHPELMVCEADFPGLQHRGIKYDSYVDCKDIFPFFDTELVSDRGEISADVKAAILNAILQCPMIPGKYKTAILTRENWPPPAQNRTYNP